jgi:DNA-binding FadR family transcriptional regulator
MLNLKSLNGPKAADVLAESLREKILSGQFGDGEDLPSERELVEQVSLSRATVREALRILEGEGLIATRIGRNGGSAVVRPSAAAIERSVSIFIRGQRLRFEAVLEARVAIEPSSARFAAQHRTEHDLLRMEACHQDLQSASRKDDLQAYIRANLDWHVAVVRASHNELLIAFISSVSESVHKATDLDGINPVETRNAVIHAHRRVMDAIRAGDGVAAERRMTRHVSAYIEHVRANTTDQKDIR